MNRSNYQHTSAKWQNYVVLFLMLYFTNFMSFRAYEAPQRMFIFPLVYLCLFLLLRNQNYLIGKPLASNVKLIILSFFLSCIPSMLVFGQGLYAALAGQMEFLFPLLLYFVLHKWNVEEQTIYKYLIGFTIIFAFFEIFQQFTYPTYWFGGRTEDEHSGLLEERMGFWRFYLFGIDYVLLVCMLIFGKILRKEGKQGKNYIYLICSAVAIYFFLARKDIYATVSCIALGVLFSSGRSSIFQKSFIAILLVVAYAFLSGSMLELNDQTSLELGEGSEDFIRFVAAEHFMYEFSDSPWYYLFGAGVPGGDNALYSTISGLIDNYRIYQDDCGFVGYFSRFGLFGIFAQILILYKIARNYTSIDIELVLFAVLQLELSFFDFWGNNSRNMAAWAIYLYLIDRSIERNTILEEK